MEISSYSNESIHCNFKNLLQMFKSMNLIKLNASYKDFHNGMLRSRNNATTVKQRFQFKLETKRL